MNNKKIIFIVFILVALAQLFVPAKMILDREEVLNEGKEFKFRTAPIDPNDPFRGKYIVLSFENNTVDIQNQEDWLEGEAIYVLLSEDGSGYVTLDSVSKDKSAFTQDFLKAKVSWVNGNKLTVEYPFDRYYMEESKAYDAELEYRESQIDTTRIAYALVSIKDGEAVLKDVLIDGIPIREIVKNKLEEKK